MVKEKELPAKPFKRVGVDGTLVANNNFITIDIETITIDGQMKPYLITGYTDGEYIHSYTRDVSFKSESEMFVDFIGQLLRFNKVKNIYAHNLSGFDGILLLKYLINYTGAKVEPLLFNGKIISIKFILNQNSKKARTIVFKDSYLLLPHSLRNLCKSFDVPIKKANFPFFLTNIHYVGEFPDYGYWSNISNIEYETIKEQHGNGLWNFKEESIKYCRYESVITFPIKKTM
jgi:hypothetical protein